MAEQRLLLMALCSPILSQGVAQFPRGILGSPQSVQQRDLSKIASKVDPSRVAECSFNPEDNLYNYFAEDIHNEKNVSLSQFKGSVSLVVNVATYWGLTPQYFSLNALTEKYANRPFEILGFPCNQFLNQEPGGEGTEILNGLKYVRPGNGFEPNFNMFAKTNVNGAGENPIFTFIKSRCHSPVDGFSPSSGLLYEPKNARDIRWNFEKILVDSTGAPVRRYEPSVDPSLIAEDIENLLRLH